jgi:hypothetical protein
MSELEQKIAELLESDDKQNIEIGFEMYSRLDVKAISNELWNIAFKALIKDVKIEANRSAYILTGGGVEGAKMFRKALEDETERWNK